MRILLLFLLSVSFLLTAPLRAQQAAQAAFDFTESVGVCTHFDYTNTLYVTEFSSVKDLLGELGVKYIRDRAGVNNDRGQARCRELYDDLGIKSVAVFNPRKNGRFLAPERIDEQVARAATYPQMYAAFEGPNEYDNNYPDGDPDWVGTLYAFQEQLYSTVKDHPQASVRRMPVLGPSVTFSRRTSVNEMGDFSGVCDYYNVHAYPGALEPGRKINDYLVRVPEVNGPISLYATETGYHNALAQGPKSHYPINEQGEAKYLPRLFMDYFSKGIVKTFTYEFLNKQPDPGNTEKEENFGLVRNDLTPKPAFYAVKNMLSILSDGPAGAGVNGSLNYTLSGQTEGVKQLLFQKSDGKFYLALWREVSVWDRNAQQDLNNPTAPLTITFNQSVAESNVYLPYNEGSPSGTLRPVATATAPSAISIDLPDHLMIVEIEPGAKDDLTGTFQLMAKHSGRALSVDLNPTTNGGFSDPTTSGTNVFQYGTNARINRRWRIEPVGQEGYYLLTNVYSGKALSVDLNPRTNGGYSNPAVKGTNLFQYSTTPDDNRLWKVEAVGEGYYKLTNKYSGKVLDVESGSLQDGANVLQWNYKGGDNQHWKLVPVPATAAATGFSATTTGQVLTADASVVSIFPNPASDQLTVATERPYQITLYDVTGRLLLQQPHPGGSTGLEVGHLPAGMYTLSLAAGGEVLHRYRVVKE